MKNISGPFDYFDCKWQYFSRKSSRSKVCGSVCYLSFLTVNVGNPTRSWHIQYLQIATLRLGNFERYLRLGNFERYCTEIGSAEYFYEINSCHDYFFPYYQSEI